MKSTDHRKIAIISGGTGLIGSKLTKRLVDNDYQVYVLTRSPGSTAKNGIQQVYWNPVAGEIDDQSLPAADAVFNLAGAPIVGKKWTKSYQNLIIQSRVQSARMLGQLFEKKNVYPGFYLGASAIGIYGNSGSIPVDETHVGQSSRFIVKSVLEWEKAHRQIAKPGMRSVILRIGLVLSKQGGMIEKMLLPARLGVYGYFGNGTQMQSWIHIDDLVSCMMEGMHNQLFEGTINAVAPAPVSAKALSTAMRKSRGLGILPGIPKFLLKLGMGDMHRILLDSCHAKADKLLKTGFHFKYPEIDSAMKAMFDSTS
jgi:hypothetical protein